MKGLLFATLVFAAVAFARYKIFELDEKPTSKLYEKPVWLKTLLISKDAIPANYSRTSADDASTVKLEGAHVQVPSLASVNLPQPTEIKELLIQSYVSSSGHKVNVVTARYPGREALARLLRPEHKPPRYHVIDHCLTWFDADDDDVLKAFNAAFEANAVKSKKSRIQIEKALVGSQATLKFMADLLVGAFGFVLALFFAKYFLIMRQTEE